MEGPYVDSFKELPPTAQKIISHLAIVKEDNKYHISKQIDKFYSGVHKYIKKLMDFKMIEISNTRTSEKNINQIVNFYTLTEIGLYNALNLLNVENKIDKVAEIHKSKLPLIFGKWGHFKKYNVLDIVKTRLFGGVFFLRPYLSRMPISTYVEKTLARKEYIKTYNNVDMNQIKENKSKLKINELDYVKELISDYDIERESKILYYDIDYYLTNTILGIRYVLLNENYRNTQPKVITAVLKDKELRDYVLNEVMHEVKDLDESIHMYLNWVEQISNYINTN